MRIFRTAFLLPVFALSLACSSEEVDHRVTVIIPADVPTVASGVLRMHLWVYDPYLADASATQADAATANFSHRAGERDRLTMRVRGHVPAGMRHYITIRGFERTAEGERYILWDGIQETSVPTVVVMRHVGSGQQ